MRFLKKSLIFAAVGVLLLYCMLAAACNPKETVTVTLHDGDSTSQVTVTTGEVYNLGLPEKAGYSFLGWYSAETSGNAYTDAQGQSAGLVWNTENTTDVYAHWQANEYRIVFDYCGGAVANASDSIKVTYDTEIGDAFPVPQKDGGSFTGWFTEENGGKQITDAYGNLVDGAKVFNVSMYTLGEEGTTLYAHYGEKMVTYMFTTDGSAVDTVSYAVGTKLSELPVSTKEDYCFQGWFYDPEHLSAVKFPLEITDKTQSFITLYAKFVHGSLDVLQFDTIASSRDKEYEVSYFGSDTSIVIPDFYFGKPVTGVKRIESSTVKEILLPQSIKSLSASAFEGCSALEKVNLSVAVKEIPERAFAGCAALTSVNMPVNVESIGDEAFSGCRSLKSITVPATVTEIGDGAFRNMASLANINVATGNEKYISKGGVLYSKMGNSVYLVQYPAAKSGSTYEMDANTVKIMEYAFSSSRLKSITIGGKINSIEEGAFEKCKNLASVSISSKAVTFTIDKNAFLDCSNLKALMVELSKVPVLNATAFEGVSNTFSIYVTSNMVRTYQNARIWRDHADSIYSIGSIFGDYAVLEVEDGYEIRQYFGTEAEVVIPEILNAKKVVGIAENAFAYSAVEKVTVTKNVVAIGNNAFKGSSKLQSIIMECDVPLLGTDVFSGISKDFGIYIRNTLDVLDAYKSAEGWSDIIDKISSSND